MAQMGRVIPYHLSNRHRSILLRRFRRKSCTATMECKQLTKVLLLMKGSSAMLSFMALCVALITCVDTKQNLSHVCFLGPHTLSNLIFLIICVDIKQNLGYAWPLGPHALGKLIYCIISLSIKQNLGYTWPFGSHALGNLIFHIISLSIKQNLVNVGPPQIICFE